ncbi:hypothetical protein FRB95_006485 [Tulasnella sp. JGI-2019a]|nr:hypothetical protein FRB95_006485 [Tulasnella sp. JGI-2019a]
MRLFTLPLCLLSLVFSPSSSFAAPSRSSSPSSSTTTTTSTTIIDALSSDPDYVLLLRLIQRAKLVPTLNTLNGTTLLAPTNDAIEWYRNHTSSSFWSDALEDEDIELKDNVQQALRQHLFYHLLNYTLDAIPEGVTVQETLHYPALSTEPPTKQPPPNEPWLPVPGGLLGGEPQRLRTLLRKGDEKPPLFGVDHRGKSGAKQVKDTAKAANGIIYGLDRVLELPPSLLDQVRAHPSLKIMARLLSDEMKKLLETTPHMTLFFPQDEAWDALDAIERRYLESGFAQKDMEKIVGLHASVDGPDGGSVTEFGRKKPVGWSDTWKTNGTTEFATLRDHTLHLNTTTSPPTIGHNATVIDTDIYASNGVLHTVSSLLLSPTVFKLNAEKYLLALNATQFVGLLRLANLSSYVDDHAKSWTILAPEDGVMNWNPILHHALKKGGGGAGNDTELQRLLKYHFIPGKLTPADLSDKELLKTELREGGLGGGRQVVEVSVRGKDGKATANGNGEIGFGGALVLGEPVEIGDSIIYVLSSPLTPPTDVMASLLPSLSYTTFLTSVFATKLSDILATHPLTTVLVPRNEAWSGLGLVADHLLTAKEALRRVVLHHVLKGVIYPEDEILGGLDWTTPTGAPSTSRTFPTLEGSDVRIDDGQVTASGGWPSTSSSSPIHIQHLESTTLTRTGTVYAVTGGLLIPRSVHIGVEDLAIAGKGSIMIGLVRKAGLGGVLNGTLRLDWDEHEWDDGWADRGKKKRKGTGKDPKGEKVGWTLLCPTDEGFKGMNLTALLEDPDALGRFVRQHLIPVASGDIAAAAHAGAVSAKSTSPFWFFEWMFGASYYPLTGGVGGKAPSDVEVGMPLPVMDEATFSTLLSPSAIHGDVVFRAVEGGGADSGRFLVGIKGASGGNGQAEFANVLKWGRATPTNAGTSDSTIPSNEVSSDQSHFALESTTNIVADSSQGLRSGVVLINRPLTPYVEGWWVTWGQASLLGFVGSIVIMAGFALLVNWFRTRESEATYEPIGPGAGGEDE